MYVLPEACAHMFFLPSTLSYILANPTTSTKKDITSLLLQETLGEGRWGGVLQLG